MARVAFDPFEALGLPRDASTDAIKARYHALALRYHPNRHQGSSEQQKSTFSDHFHHVHEAYNLLCKADNRRRRAELLDLLDLQDSVLAHFADLVEQPDTPEQQTHHDGEDKDGHVSSDADDDLPNLGLQRRQTDLSRHANGDKHLGDQPESPSSLFTPISPTKKRLQWPKLASISSVLESDRTKDADYFTKRRKKLKKLEKQELEAFWSYREAMTLKFKAEEEAEKHRELFERARWKRQYFERAPKETRERMRSFQHFMGAVSAFENHTPRPRNRSTVSYGSGSPMNGPGESNQFLNPDNARPKHRRHWSSDISGDQTSSEDDSGDAYSSRPRPFVASGHWPQPGNGSSNASLELYRGRPHVARDRHSDSRAELSAEFQLVVRQPTDLGSIPEAQSSSGDTPSPSSREPSPRPQQPMSPSQYKYTIVPSLGPAQLLDAATDRRTRSISPVGRTHSTIVTHSRDVQEHTSDGCSLELKKIGTPHHNHIPRKHVRRLNDADKARLLGAESDAAGAAAEAAKLLEKLADLAPRVAAKFEVKQDIKKSFNFRLIYGHKDLVSQDHQSFIALSYRRKLQVKKTESLFTLPLEREIFEAVWQERHENEGIW